MRDRRQPGRIEAEIASHLAEIRIPRAPALLLGVVGRARGFCTSSTERLDEAIAANWARYRRAFVAWFGSSPDHDQPALFTSTDRVLSMGALCLVLFEALCAAFLASITFAVPFAVAVLIGVGLTAVLTLTMKAIWCLHVAADDTQPRRAVLTLYRWLLPLFVVWTAALSVALILPRFIHEATPVLEICFNVAMSVLTVVSPALGGLLFTASGLYGWARPRVTEAAKLRQLRRDVETLSRECDRIVDKAQTPAEGRTPSRSSSIQMPGRVGPVVLFVMVVLGAGTSAYAQPRGELWLDDSTSMNRAELKNARDRFFAVLPGVLETGSIPSWEFFRFTRNALNAGPVASLNIGRFVAPACASPGAAGELVTLFRRPRAAATQRADQECAERRALARSQYDHALAAVVAKVREAVDAPPAAIGSCTAIVDLLHRLSSSAGRTPSSVTILSDGIESCVPARGLRFVPPPPALRVTLVVVPSVNAGRRLTPWQEFVLRRDSWLIPAPWLQVIPISQLTATTLAPR